MAVGGSPHDVYFTVTGSVFPPAKCAKPMVMGPSNDKCACPGTSAPATNTRTTPLRRSNRTVSPAPYAAKSTTTLTSIARMPPSRLPTLTSWAAAPASKTPTDQRSSESVVGARVGAFVVGAAVVGAVGGGVGGGRVTDPDAM